MNYDITNVSIELKASLRPMTIFLIKRKKKQEGQFAQRNSFESTCFLKFSPASHVNLNIFIAFNFSTHFEIDLYSNLNQTRKLI